MGTDGSAPGLSPSRWQIPQGVRREGDAQLVPGELPVTPAAGNKKIIEANKVKGGRNMRGCKPGWGEPQSHSTSLPGHPPAGPQGGEMPIGAA